MLKVMEGIDGWLFLDNDRNRVIDQVQGKFSASLMDWHPVEEAFKERMGLADLYGFRYLYLIVPNTHVFAKEHLPKRIQVSEDRSAVYMQEHFPEVVFYPIELLRSRKDEYTLYHKTDTHWTEQGAILVFNEISNRMGLNTAIDLDGKYETRIMCRGDLGTKLSPTRTSTYQHLVYDYGVKMVSTNRIMNTGAYRHLRSKNKNQKRAVIFGDSYINAGLEQIAYYFEETFFFWQANIFDLNIIDQLRPNIVINETAERFFNGKFIEKRRYYHVLLDKILELDSKRRDAVDLSDDFYDSSIQKWLGDYKKTCEKLEDATVDWSKKYRNLIEKIGWIKKQPIFPLDEGGQGVGYHFLYLLCRILEEGQPQQILELNFGQATKIVAQYASSHGIKHKVLEANRDRVNFYLKTWGVSCSGTRIYISPILPVKWCGKVCASFKAFHSVVEETEYDCILIKCTSGGGQLYTCGVFRKVA